MPRQNAFLGIASGRTPVGKGFGLPLQGNVPFKVPGGKTLGLKQTNKPAGKKTSK